MITFVLFIIFYLIGTLPTGYLIAKYKGIDITATGSGNVGATNVARTLGKKLGILTLLLDALKGALAVFIADLSFHNNLTLSSLAGLTCVLGHCFSIPKYLKGGKGVATALGVASSLNIIFLFVALISFGLSILIFRIVSVISLVASVSVCLASILLGWQLNEWLPLALINIVIFYRHKENLQRLINGQEKKFSFGKSS